MGMPDTFTLTADEVLAGHDLTGRRVVVTGATSGLGLATAQACGRAGAELVILGRDDAKLSAAVATIGHDARPVRVDLADLRDVAAVSAKLAADLDRVDLLVLNAGVMAAPLERTPQGHEMQLAVGLLGHHLLTTALLGAVTAAHGRVVALSSGAHWLAAFDFDDPDYLTRDYEPWAAYGQSRTATALFAIELARRSGPDGVVAASVHPGVIKTELQRHLAPAEEQHILAQSEERGELRSVEAGAASIVWAGVADEVAAANGCYVANCSVANEQRAPHASSPDDAARLWDWTESVVAPFR